MRANRPTHPAVSNGGSGCCGGISPQFCGFGFGPPPLVKAFAHEPTFSPNQSQPICRVRRSDAHPTHRLPSTPKGQAPDRMTHTVSRPPHRVGQPATGCVTSATSAAAALSLRSAPPLSRGEQRPRRRSSRCSAALGSHASMALLHVSGVAARADCMARPRGSRSRCCAAPRRCCSVCVGSDDSEGRRCASQRSAASAR